MLSLWFYYLRIKLTYLKMDIETYLYHIYITIRIKFMSREQIHQMCIKDMEKIAKIYSLPPDLVNDLRNAIIDLKIESALNDRRK